MDKPIEQQSPVEIDTALSVLWEQEQKWRMYVAKERSYRRTWVGQAARLGEIDVRIEEYLAKAEGFAEQAQPLQDEFFRRGGWNRYFLVTNSNGHVHRGTNCSTCYPTTTYAWLIDLADCDEAAMIEEWGEKACTVCFPNAPTHPRFSQPSRRDQAAQAARDAEKVAKAAEKAAKAITAPDGSPLVVERWPGHRETIKTKVAAQRELSDAVQTYGFYGQDSYVGAARVLMAALEAVGIDPQPIIDRATKKVAREGGKHDIRESLQ